MDKGECHRDILDVGQMKRGQHSLRRAAFWYKCMLVVEDDLYYKHLLYTIVSVVAMFIVVENWSIGNTYNIGRNQKLSLILWEETRSLL